MNNSANAPFVEDFNTIISFLSRRDIKELTSEALLDEFGITEVDIIIVLGNSIPYIAELGAKVFKAGLAKELMIVGGIGHSTNYLVQNVLKYEEYRGIDVHEKSEADILTHILVRNEQMERDRIIIERNSTNCGSNAYEALKVLKEADKVPGSVILLQDPTMQLRTHASFQEVWKEENTLLISFSPFVPQVNISEGQYEFTNKGIKGLWTIDRFVDLIMGEIPRLRDDENGYGPKGKGFISHVEIPEEVMVSYQNLLNHYSEYREIKNRK